jgi:hypothetical protein
VPLSARVSSATRADSLRGQVGTPNGPDEGTRFTEASHCTCDCQQTVNFGPLSDLQRIGKMTNCRNLQLSYVAAILEW